MGNIPKSDNPEILRFLMWITKGANNRFYTPSSDVFCLALVLQAIGIDRLRPFDADKGKEPQFDEQHLVVILKADTVGSMVIDPCVVRRGMPIPLEQPEEVISLWPCSKHKHLNPLQEDFEKGMHAAKGLKFMLRSKPGTRYTTTNHREPDLYYEISSTTPETNRKLKGDAETLARRFFPLVTDETANFLHDIARNWEHIHPIWELEEAICEDRDFLGRLQSFVMGFYYAALKPLINTSQLRTQEAFGAWGWWDYELLQVVKDLRWDAPGDAQIPSKGSTQCWRFALMKVIAYLFAGTESELVRRLDNRATGVIAKLCLLTADMLGKAISQETASQFYLLDVDGSCIPSSQGIVMSGLRTSSIRKSMAESMIQPLDGNVHLEGRLEDFTTHIEPDWAKDKQTCLVAFRDKGRIVQRMSPVDCDVAIIFSALSHPSIPNDQQNGVPAKGVDAFTSEGICLVPLEQFYGGEIITRSPDVWPAWNKKLILIPTRNLPKARTCLMSMYLESFEWEGFTPRYPYQLPPFLEGSLVLYDEKALPIVLA